MQAHSNHSYDLLVNLALLDVIHAMWLCCFFIQHLPTLVAWVDPSHDLPQIEALTIEFLLAILQFFIDGCDFSKCCYETSMLRWVDRYTRARWCSHGETPKEEMERYIRQYGETQQILFLWWRITPKTQKLMFWLVTNILWVSFFLQWILEPSELFIVLQQVETNLHPIDASSNEKRATEPKQLLKTCLMEIKCAFLYT